MEPTPPDLFMSLLVVQPSFCSPRRPGGVAHLGLVRPMKLALRSMIAIAAIAPVVTPATELLASRPASIGFPTTWVVRGQIELVSAGGVLAFHSAEPFWGPPCYGGDRVWLWPTGTLFIAQISARTPTTIDGQKTTTSRLSPGQWAQVQYTIVEIGERRKYPSM